VTLTWIRTLEWLVTGVSVDMMIQLGARDKPLPAIAAGQLGSRVVVLHMIVQAVLSSE
jgi:hypothetical protein